MGVVPHLCLFLSCLAGVRSVIVDHPASVVVKPGESHKLNCKVDGVDLKKRNVHWVRMTSGKELEWLAIVWTTNKPDYMPALRDRLIASKSGGSVFLEMKDLKVEDTAVYYCAKDGGTPVYDLQVWGEGTSLTVTSEVKSTPSLYITASWNKETDQDISLLCLVKDYQPESISQTWSTNSGDITTGIKKYPAVLGQNSKYTMSSLLRVSVADWTKNKVYSCKAGYKPNEIVTVKIQSLNLISLVPSPEDVQSQATAVLGCMIYGLHHHNFNIAWKKDGLVQTGNILPSTSRINSSSETFTYLSMPMKDWTNKSEYTCEVNHPYGFRKLASMRYAEELSVFIQNPDIEEMWISKTATVKCTVLCTDPQNIHISWLVNGTESKNPLSSEQPESKGIVKIVISTFSSTVEEWLSGVEYECSVQDLSTFSKMSAKTKRTKGITKRPDVRLLLPTEEEIKTNGSAVLECVAVGFYPDHLTVTWEKGSSAISSGTRATPTALEQGGTFSVRHFLTVSLQEWKTESVFSCTVSHPPSNSSIKKQVKNVQELSVLIQNPDIEEVWIRKTATVKCTVLCTDPQNIHISWLVNGTESKNPLSSEQPESKGIVKIVISTFSSTVEEWLSGVEYECSVQDLSTFSKLSAKTKRTKGTTKRPDVRLLLPTEEEIKSNGSAVLECVAAGFYPDHITVTWQKGSSAISSGTRATPTALEQGGTFSVRHFLTVSLQEWKTESVFSCTVSHPPSNSSIKKQVKNIQGTP
ncbi:immunoglobulin gamma-1 heavy chain-like [Hemitrygon akajei]|uniref:immunoglobulin gamma-1 heavy chain-like n=1 Tax=Hemitrygon akajei TaxID=2704970 RepID=UPI003BF945A2